LPHARHRIKRHPLTGLPIPPKIWTTTVQELLHEQTMLDDVQSPVRFQHVFDVGGKVYALMPGMAGDMRTLLRLLQARHEAETQPAPLSDYFGFWKQAEADKPLVDPR
jgi:hypothetical protein